VEKLRVMSVVGARPNFMKIAPFAHAIEKHNARGVDQIEHFLVHTGQHYDAAMSERFFKVLDIPKPDVDLGIGSGTHAEQVGQTMIAFEKVVRDWKPDWVIVVGDVNATCACSITAKKEHLNLAHIEAGLRSYDLLMPEEINRMVTDRLSDILFTTDAMADENLLKEGTSPERIMRVGNVMIDTLEANRAKAECLEIEAIVASHAIGGSVARDCTSPAERSEESRFPPVGRSAPCNAALHLGDDRFAVLTLHRPSNVDDAETLGAIVDVLINDISSELPLLWTIHPRTRQRLKDFGLWQRVLDAEQICLLEPLGYHELMALNMKAAMMLTDSGGLQEECCVLGTPCLTLRENTERPVTLVEHGGLSKLVGNDPDRIRKGFHEFLQLPRGTHRPELWDGHAAERIVAALVAG
jgi:UDP-N-acetylglucosamine 2-epimerase (non-hydrolysing)